MGYQGKKGGFILTCVLICTLLIIIQILLGLFGFAYVPLHFLLLVTEFILAICGLMAVHGWCAPTWKRLCAICTMLGVICWTIFWPLAFIVFLPGMCPNP